MSDEQPVDARGSGWYRFLEHIEYVIARGDVAWAEETLKGIRSTVERTQQVTEGQRAAVEKIEAAAKKRHGVDRVRYGYESGHYRKWIR